MNEFYNYLPEDAIEDNLKENITRMNLLHEQEISHLHELAVQMTRDCEIHNDWISSLADKRSPIFPLSASPIASNRDMLQQWSALTQEWQSVFLCKELRKILQNKQLLSLSLFFPELSDLPQRPLCRIAYQRNTYADSAYLRFAEHVQDPRSIYTHSFISACEDVYNGICDCCILPTESSSEGQLGSFLRLIEQYELKIIATCDVNATDTSRFTRFALLARYPAPLTKTGKESYLELLTPLGEDPTAASLLSAAQLCGLRLYRINSLPSKSENDFFVHTIFQTNGADLYAFLLYLSMQAPNHVPIGIYYHI